MLLNRKVRKVFLRDQQLHVEVRTGLGVIKEVLSLNPQLCLGASPPSLSCNQGHHFNRIILQWGVLGGEGGECCGEMVVDGDAPQPSIIPHTHSRTQQNLSYYLHGTGSSALISTSVTSLISMNSNFSPIYPKERNTSTATSTIAIGQRFFFQIYTRLTAT